MTPWLGTPTSYASGYISAQRVVSSSPAGPCPPTCQSLTVEFSSPPTYWMGLLTRSSSGSRSAHRDSPDIPPCYGRGRAPPKRRPPTYAVGPASRITPARVGSPVDVHRVDLGEVLLRDGAPAQLHARR